MAAHVSSIAEYWYVAINFTLGSGITQYASTNSAWKYSFQNFQICLSFELAGRNVQFGLIIFIIFPFMYETCQDEDSNTALMKLAWLERSACP